MIDYLIRGMARNELDTVLGWAEQEGWRPGIADAGHFYQTDPQGFFIGLLNGEPIGSISAIKYGDDHGFIGLYLVKPEWRKQGFGIQLWQTAMRHLEGRNIGLDGVIAQQSNYQKSGFKIAYRHVRYQGTTDARQASADASVVSAASLPFDDISAYDAALFPASRRVFLQAWLKQQQGTSLAAVRHGQLVGYAVIRACHNGYRIGPLFADSYDDAENLLAALLATLPEGCPFFIDIPEPNQQALVLVASRNMQPVFETARMYTRAMPEMDVSKIFAVTSLELG